MCLLQLMDVKRTALERMQTKVAVWPKKESRWTERDVRNAVETEERRYRNVLDKGKERAKRRTDHVEDCKRLWAEETARRHGQLARDRELEVERREREKSLLTEFAELRRKSQIETVNRLGAQLDRQCVSMENDKTWQIMSFGTIYNFLMKATKSRNGHLPYSYKIIIIYLLLFTLSRATKQPGY